MRKLLLAALICTPLVAESNEPAKGRFPENPNGSVDDIAGVCDATGLVFGLMPHPERHVSALQHPAWKGKNAGEEGGCREIGAGLAVFRNAVEHVGSAVGSGT